MSVFGTFENVAAGPSPIEGIALAGTEIATDLVGNALTGALLNWTSGESCVAAQWHRMLSILAHQGANCCPRPAPRSAAPAPKSRCEITTGILPLLNLRTLETRPKQLPGSPGAHASPGIGYFRSAGRTVVAIVETRSRQHFYQTAVPSTRLTAARPNPSPVVF
jgi:hypothetical protein